MAEQSGGRAASCVEQLCRPYRDGYANMPPDTDAKTWLALLLMPLGKDVMHGH